MTDARIAGARVEGDALTVRLTDGRATSAPVAWCPRLANATPEQRRAFEVAGGGYGLHWPTVDEDVSVEGLLRGIPARP